MTGFQVMTNENLRALSVKIYFWWEEQVWHKLYSEANIGVLIIDISWKYITENEKHLSGHIGFSL